MGCHFALCQYWLCKTCWRPSSEWDVILLCLSTGCVKHTGDHQVSGMSFCSLLATVSRKECELRLLSITEKRYYRLVEIMIFTKQIQDLYYKTHTKSEYGVHRLSSFSFLFFFFFFCCCEKYIREQLKICQVIL